MKNMFSTRGAAAQVLFLSMLFSPVSIGSQPLSIQRIDVHTVGGIEYTAYRVRCDDGGEGTINSHGEFPHKEWCVGDSGGEECKTGRVKVKVAKLACK